MDDYMCTTACVMQDMAINKFMLRFFLSQLSKI